MAKEASQRSKEVVEKFKKSRQAGVSAEMMQLAEWDPDYFEKFTVWSGHPIEKNILPLKTRELIFIAIDAACTHLYQPGLRRHIRNALDIGITKEEILAVLELVSVLGIHSCTVGLPILAEECEKKALPHLR